jgi:hypothetical protein
MICTHCSHDNTSSGPEMFVEVCRGIYKNFRIICLTCKQQFAIDNSKIHEIKHKNFKKMTFEYNPPMEIDVNTHERIYIE